MKGVLLRGDKVVIPISLENKVVKMAHEGHQGLEKTRHSEPECGFLRWMREFQPLWVLVLRAKLQ